MKYCKRIIWDEMKQRIRLKKREDYMMNHLEHLQDTLENPERLAELNPKE